MSLLDRSTNKANIDLVIDTNGANEITGAKLNTILNDIADSYANLVDELSLLGLKEYDPARTYNTGDGVIFEFGIFQANEDTITGVFNPLKWTLIERILRPADYTDFTVYDNSTTYNIGDRVQFQNRFFVCDINGTVGILPNDASANWTESFASLQFEEPAPEWVPGFYKEDMVVRRNQMLYFLDVDTSVNSFESTDIDAEIIAGDWVLFNNISIPSGAAGKLAFFNLAGQLDAITNLTYVLATNVLTLAAKTTMGEETTFPINGGANNIIIKTTAAEAEIISNDGDPVVVTGGVWDFENLIQTRGGLTIKDGAFQANIVSSHTGLRFHTLQDKSGDLAHTEDMPIMKSAIVPGASFTGNPKIFQVTFSTAFPNTNYSVSVAGMTGANRSFTIASRLVSGFIIETNSNTQPTGDVMWTASENGEFN